MPKDPKFFNMNRQNDDADYEQIQRLGAGIVPSEKILELFRERMSLERVYEENPDLRYTPS